MSLFDDETALTAIDEGRWSGRVGSKWSIGDNPNGGYLIAVALRAFKDLAPGHPDPLSVTAHFLRPGMPNAPCDVNAALVRSGRSLSNGRATLIQDGKPRIELVTALGDLDAVADPVSDHAVTLPPAEMPPPEECPQRSGDEQGIHLPLLERMDVRIHPDQARAGAAGKAEVSGYIRFRDDAPVDALATIVFADAFPPSVFGLLGMVGWVPTIELTVHVRRRPAPGWIFGRFQTDDLSGNQMIESGALWDSDGHLIAQSRQLGLVMRAS